MKAWAKPPQKDATQSSLFSSLGKTLERKKSLGTVEKEDTNDKDKTGKEEDKKLEMEALHLYYEEYLKTEENLSGVLNTKTLNLKNMELRDKINNWRESQEFREGTTEKTNEKQRQVFEVLSRYHKELSMDKDMIEKCKGDLLELMENRNAAVKSERTLNDFLLTLKDFKILEIRDVKKGLDTYKSVFYNNHAMLNDFVDKISRECVLNQHFFSFFDVPDLIVKMAPNKTDYSQMVKLLSIAKTKYLDEKSEILKKPKADCKITDEDLVPLELLRFVLSEMKHEFTDKCSFINRFIRNCEDEVAKKIRQLQVENAKIKKTIENNVFVGMLNQKMDESRTEVFTLTYKIRILHIILTKTMFNNAKEISRKYWEIIQISVDNNKEFKDRLANEMSNFSNKEVHFESSDTISDIEGDKLTKAFSRLGAFREGMANRKREEDSEALDEISKSLRRELDGELGDTNRSKDSLMDGTLERDINEPDIGILDKGLEIKPFKLDYKPPEPPKFGQIEEEDEEERQAMEERRKREAEEREWMSKYRDTETGEPYNPIKKFGLIEKDYLVYDNATSSYPLNLPVDYYQRYI